jgi:hypothetical protein
LPGLLSVLRPGCVVSVGLLWAFLGGVGGVLASGLIWFCRRPWALLRLLWSLSTCPAWRRSWWIVSSVGG